MPALDLTQPRRPRRRARRGPLVVLAAVLVALAVGGIVLVSACGKESSEAEQRSGYDAKPTREKVRVPTRWAKLAADLAAPWPDLQIKEGKFAGRFPDYTDRYIKGFPLTRYGEAVLGYALVQTGAREGDDRLVDSGMKALAYVANRPPGTHHRASVFEDMAMPSAYNFIRRELPDHPIFKRNRAAWERFLRKIRPVSTPYRVPETRRYSNHYLVEAIGVLELLKTGLRSSRAGATLGGKRALATAVTYRLLNEQIPGFAAQDQVRVRGDKTFILSDPPDNPLAYQGFSVGFYARALRVLDKDDSPAARAALRGALNASLWLTAPDGSSGYFGRSQEQAWSLSATANGAETAARLAGSSRGRDRRYRALAERALTRLRDAYGVGRTGMFIVPAMRTHMRLGARGVDVNAGAPSFAGVTLMVLNWALEDMPTKPRVGRIGADANKVVRLSKGESRFAVVRRGRLWFAVRQTRSVRRKDDLRYDFGLVSLKVRGSGGRWRDVLRLRPRRVTGPDSAGPALLRDGLFGLPYGTGLTTSRRGTVTVTGGFKTAEGVVMRRGVVFRFQPTGCGVRMVWPAQQGDQFELSTFMRRSSKPRQLSPFALGDADQIVRFNAPTSVSLEGAYSSAVDPILVRARSLMVAKRTKPMRVTVCKP